MKKCYNCRQENEFDSDDDYLCRECKAAGERMVPVACHSLSDGPGNHYFCFDRPDPAGEMAHTFKVMEEKDKFKTPETKKKAAALLNNMKVAQFKKVDYGKGDALHD